MPAVGAADRHHVIRHASSRNIDDASWLASTGKRLLTVLHFDFNKIT
jgi:hypothetical protein